MAGHNKYQNTRTFAILSTEICYTYGVLHEAQLSQRDRAMLRVIEDFTKTFEGTEIIRNDTL